MLKIQTLGSLSEVVRCISAVLGFTPVDSLVLVELRGGELGCVLRMDLDIAIQDDGPGRLADLVDGHGADGALAVVVSADAGGRDRFRAMVSEVGAALRDCDRELFGAVVVDRIEAGGRWTCMDGCGASGLLGDPSSSVLAAAAVVDGRRLYGSRDEMAATVAVDVARAATLARLLGPATPVDSVEESVRAAVDAMRRLARNEALTDSELVSVGTSLADVRVRDALFNIGNAEETAAAESLWTVLARVLPVPLRSEALTLLAFSAFLRGDGPLAGVALEAVLVDNPRHRMAGMLNIALQNGLEPARLRGLIANVPPAVTV